MMSIHETLKKGKQTQSGVGTFFKANKVGKILGSYGAYNVKTKGIPVMQLMEYLVNLVFTKKSMYMNMKNGTNDAGFKGDTVYRFLNSCCINWVMFLLTLAMSVIKPIKVATSKDRLCAIVVDDSLFSRGRSKCVELLANVHDHAAHGKKKFVRGFRMLTMGWTDGVSFIPLMFRHMSSKNKKNRYNEINPNIDKRSTGYKARLQAISTAPEVMLWMLKQAKKIGVPAKHVLFDSWFSYPSTMIAILKVGFHSVGMLKNTTTIKYIFGGEPKTLREIYAASRKRPGKARYLLSVVVQIYNDNGDIEPFRLVFVRDRKNRKKWLALGTTDVNLSEEVVIQLYGKRWDIEVFFKMCKSYLNLAKEFQGVSYDLIIAHTAIVMTRYIILAADKRHNQDHRTITELFHSCYDEMADVSFSRALTLVLDTLHATLHECITLSEEEISAIIDAFITAFSSKFNGIFCCEINQPSSVA